VKIDEWGAVLLADMLVEVGFYGERSARVAMDDERRGFSGRLPQSVGEIPFLEDACAVGGDL
jgi:hypothetical protein